jgi:hypothetical protein
MPILVAFQLCRDVSKFYILNFSTTKSLKIKHICVLKNQVICTNKKKYYKDETVYLELYLCKYICVIPIIHFSMF